MQWDRDIKILENRSAPLNLTSDTSHAAILDLSRRLRHCVKFLCFLGDKGGIKKNAEVGKRVARVRTHRPIRIRISCRRERIFPGKEKTL